MKKVRKVIVLFILLSPVLLIIFGLGLLGVIPGLSAVLGANKPKDLGIKYTQADVESVHAKSQIKYESLPEPSNLSESIKYTGSREVKAEFTSEEITASLNTQTWKNWPYSNIQVKFNADGSGEMSGNFDKNKLPGYAAPMGIPSEVTEFAQKFLPENTTFYVKMKASLENNQISTFEPQAFSIGKIPMPLNMFLSLGGESLIKEVYALDLNEMNSELSKVDNKQALIISFINSKISSVGGFYAKKAYFAENKLIFDGTLNESISYTQ